MEHRVKVTVLDKKLFPELQRSTAPCRTAASVLVTVLAMSLCFIATMSEMISGTWVLEHL